MRLKNTRYAQAQAASTDYAPRFIYDSGGFLSSQGTSFNIVTTADAYAGDCLVLTHVGGGGGYLTSVTSSGGTWTLGQRATASLEARTAVIKLNADLPAGSTITVGQAASTGPSVMVFGWKGGIAIDQSAPAPYLNNPAWSTTISDSNLPCYCAALITVNADVGSIGLASGWSVGDVHGSTYGTKLIYRRIETGQSPVTISSGSTGSGQSMVYVTFTAPPPGGAPGTTVVSNVSQLQATFAAANPGDTIALAAGVNFSGAVLQNKTFSGTRVTIKSNDTNNKATLTNLSIQNVYGVTIQDVKIGISAGGTGLAITSGCSQITVTNYQVLSSGRTGVGIGVSGSTNITIQDGSMSDVFRGIQMLDSGGTIQRNKFTLLGEDAIHFSACQNLTIRRNFFTNWNTSPGEHADAVQHTVGGSGSSSSNITIQENLDTLGTGNAHQSFFLADMSITTADVSRNLSVGPANHGYMLSAITGGTFDGNKTIPINSTGYGAWLTEDNETNCTITNNQYGALVQSGTNTNVTLSGNTVITDPGDGGAAAITAFRALYPDIPS